MNSTDPQIKASGHQPINGHDLYWECYGPKTGPGIVLLHHGLGSIRSWKRQIAALVKSGYRVLVFDRWGYSRSNPRLEFAARFLHSDAQETVDLLNGLGVENAAFMGHSDGGSIALIVANRYPSLVNRLILVAAHIYIEPKMAKTMQLIRNAPKSLPFMTVLEQEHGSRSHALLQAWLNGWIQHGPLTLDLKDELAGVKCPTFVIQGEEDEYATPKHAEDIAKGIKDSNLWLIPNVGHMPLHEITEEFNTRMIQFLNNNKSLQVSKTGIGFERDNVQ